MQHPRPARWFGSTRGREKKVPAGYVRNRAERRNRATVAAFLGEPVRAGPTVAPAPPVAAGRRNGKLKKAAAHPIPKGPGPMVRLPRTAAANPLNFCRLFQPGHRHLQPA